MDLKKYFQKQKSGLSEKGLYFESIQGSASIKKSMLRTDNMLMRSPLVNLGAIGIINLLTSTVDGTIAVELLRTLRAVLDKVPFVARILTGKSKHLASYYFEVKGPLNNPVVKPAALKQLRGESVKQIKRILKLPDLLFRKKSKANGKN